MGIGFLALLVGGILYWPSHRARGLAAAHLIDPDSAKFRNVRRAGDRYCGEINGKNAIGAYSGFRRFVVEGDRALVAPERTIIDRSSAETMLEGIAGLEKETAFLKAWTAGC